MPFNVSDFTDHSEEELNGTEEAAHEESTKDTGVSL